MRIYQTIIISTFIFTLAGCGGGGGGSSGSSMSGGNGEGMPPPATTRRFSTDHISQVNGMTARNGATPGQGVRVGVIDTGFNLDHDEIADANIADSFDATGSQNGLDDESDHGTAVASLISGENVGIAPSATLIPIRASTGREGIFQQEAIEDSFNYLLGLGNVDVINNSYTLGIGANSDSSLVRQAIVDGITNQDWVVVVPSGNTNSSSSNNDTGFAGRYADDPDFEGQLLVVGSVNSNSQLSGFSRTATTNQDQFGDNIGIVDHFLVAPGSGVCTASDPASIGSNQPTACNTGNPEAGGLNQSYSAVSGTSFATPVVAGTVALLKANWPTLDGSEIVDILLDTATDLGAPGYDGVYGAGLLNVEEALRPQGTMRVATKQSVAGPSVVAAETRYQDAGPFGDSLAQHADALSNVVTLDRYNRDYAVDLTSQFNADPDYSDFAFSDALSQITQRDRDLAWAAIGSNTLVTSQIVTAANGEHSVGYTGVATKLLGVNVKMARFSGENAYVDGLDNKGSLQQGLLASDGFASPWSRFSDEGNELVMSFALSPDLALTARTFNGEDDDSDATFKATTVGARYRPDYRSLVSFELGQYQEKGALYGSTGSGALSLSDKASTTLLGLRGRYFLGQQTELFGSAYVGATQIDSKNSLLSDYDNVTSVSAGLGVKQHFDGNRFAGLAASTPLRAESGSVLLAVPVERDGDRLIVDERRVDLSPSGREIDVEAFYSHALTKRTRLRVNALHRRNPGHIAGSASENAAAVTLHSDF